MPGFPRAGRTHRICVAVGECREALQGLEMGEIPRFEGRCEGGAWLGSMGWDGLQ